MECGIGANDGDLLINCNIYCVEQFLCFMLQTKIQSMSGFDLAVQVQIGVLGETVGKSSLINRFFDDSFSGQHIQHKYMETTHQKKMRLLNQTFELNVIDTTNNEDIEVSHDDILKIEWKGMDGYSMDVRKSWLIESDILFILFNRLNRISWMILQAIHDVTLQCLGDNASNTPIYIVSTCSDLYLSQSSLSNLESIDLVVCMIDLLKYFHCNMISLCYIGIVILT